MVNLTQAVEDAAKATFNEQFPNAEIDWDRLPEINKHMAREAVLPIVTAASAAIAAEAWDEGHHAGVWNATDTDGVTFRDNPYRSVQP